MGGAVPQGGLFVTGFLTGFIYSGMPVICD
jgi:hypothetical protein